jgi:hypothetical protein
MHAAPQIGYRSAPVKEQYEEKEAQHERQRNSARDELMENVAQK